MTNVLSLDLKKTPIYFKWNFPILNDPPLLTQQDREQNDVSLTSLRLQCVCMPHY